MQATIPGVELILARLKGRLRAAHIREGEAKGEPIRRETDGLVNEEILRVVDLEAFVLDPCICQIFRLLGDVSFVVYAVERFS